MGQAGGWGESASPSDPLCFDNKNVDWRCCIAIATVPQNIGGYVALARSKILVDTWH
eukprot:SAG22_NODE_543_length_9289_cov_43.919151_2_plen_57_part_00